MDFVLLSSLIFAHMLADFPLQGEFLAKCKAPNASVKFIPWWYIMSVHAFIHAGFVGAITGVWQLGVVEFVTHWCIDYAKCRNRISFMTDQILHLLWKIIYVMIVMSATDGGFLK